MNSCYEDDFKGTDSIFIVSRREATGKNPGCLIHLHEYIEFYYVIKGGVKVFCDGRSEWVRAGDLAFINWCQPHRSLCFADDTEYCIVQFNLSAITCGNSDVFQTKFVSRLINDMHLFKSFFKKDKVLIGYFEQLVYEYEHKRFAYQLSVQAAIYNILAYIIRSADSQEQNADEGKINKTAADYSKRIIQYLYVRYQDEVSLDKISRYLGISTSYMCRVFKQYTGITIIDFLNQLRCKKAMSLIHEGRTMTEAAEMSGYNDYTYFSHVFKKIYGAPPKDIAKKKNI